MFDLIDLGWSAEFADHFEPHRKRGLLPARVGREDRQRYLLLGERGETAARLAGHFRHRAQDWDAYPAVGDWVALQATDEREGVIRAVLPRRTRFLRKAVLAGGPQYGPGRIEPQVLAANVDTAFLVGGLDGNFNPRRIERFLAVAWDSGAAPVIVLNKADLCSDCEGCVAALRASADRAPIHVMSALEGGGLDALQGYLGPGTTSVFLGSSGVGKSTLINRLLAEERQTVLPVRADDSAGRHATVTRELIVLPGRALVIDTPGLRELQPWEDAGGLEAVFGDIDELAEACRFRDCRHGREPGCAVREAIDAGRLDAGRLKNYRKLQREQRLLAAQRAAHQKRMARKARRSR